MKLFSLLGIIDMSKSQKARWEPAPPRRMVPVSAPVSVPVQEPRELNPASP
jgi:hypothetical protein